MPSGQSLAANTKTGIKAIRPAMVKIKLSPRLNQRSSIPKARLAWVTKSKLVSPSNVEIIVVQKKILRVGTPLKKR